MQLIEAPRIAGKRWEWHLVLFKDWLRFVAAKPTHRKYVKWLRTKKVFDRSFIAFSETFLGVRSSRKAPPVLNEIGEELIEELQASEAKRAAAMAPEPEEPPPADMRVSPAMRRRLKDDQLQAQNPEATKPPTAADDVFLRALLDRYTELNSYLCMFTFRQLGEDFLGANELFRRIGSNDFEGLRPSMKQYEAWLHWLEWVGGVRKVGFRFKATEVGAEVGKFLDGMPLDELIGDDEDVEEEALEAEEAQAPGADAPVETGVSEEELLEPLDPEEVGFEPEELDEEGLDLPPETNASLDDGTEPYWKPIPLDAAPEGADEAAEDAASSVLTESGSLLAELGADLARLRESGASERPSAEAGVASAEAPSAPAPAPNAASAEGKPVAKARPASIAAEAASDKRPQDVTPTAPESEPSEAPAPAGGLALSPAAAAALGIELGPSAGSPKPAPSKPADGAAALAAKGKVDSASGISLETAAALGIDVGSPRGAPAPTPAPKPRRQAPSASAQATTPASNGHADGMRGLLATAARWWLDGSPYKRTTAGICLEPHESGEPIGPFKLLALASLLEAAGPAEQALELFDALDTRGVLEAIYLGQAPLEQAFEVAFELGVASALEERLAHLVRYRRGLAGLDGRTNDARDARDLARILREHVTGDTLGASLVLVVRELAAAGRAPHSGLERIDWLPTLLDLKAGV